MRPAEALRRHMEMGSTGSLSVRPEEAAAISVYLMQGEILAAEAEDDGPQLVRRLVNAERISHELARSLLARLAHAQQVGDVLFGTVPDDVVMELYGRRFRQNLVDFLLAEGESEFVAREDIHVENVQVGHDSHELLEQLDALLERVLPLLPPAQPVLAAGAEPPASEFQGVLLERLPSDGSLELLLDASPCEPAETLVEVMELIEQGSLALVDPHAESIPVVDVHEDDPGPVLDTDAGESVPVVDVQEDEPVPVVDAEEDLLPLELTEEITDEHEEVMEPMVVDDLSMFEDAEPDGSTMAMFADHDHSRGRGDGLFTVARELLDTVDLSGLDLIGPAESDEELLLEMEDGDEVEAAGGAVSLRFGSPPLTHEEAITKIEVTNEVLRQLSMALDDEHGAGSGQASIQLLIESCSSQFAGLFDRIDAGRDGTMPLDRLLGNIDARPEAERRRVLNRAMQDLVERGFTMAVERMAEERFEALLERIAGFQGRLGL
jgi:hypothetical protein